MTIRICQQIEDGQLVMVYPDGHTLTFAQPRETHDCLEIARATTEDPEGQREIALALLRWYGLVRSEAADPVPEEGGEP